jgi:hypothetical protein
MDIEHHTNNYTMDYTLYKIYNKDRRRWEMKLRTTYGTLSRIYHSEQDVDDAITNTRTLMNGKEKPYKPLGPYKKYKY